MKNRRVIELQRGKSMEIEDFDANAITTAKYNMFTFFPKTMLNFFFRLGNLFFLVISIIMLSNSSVNPFNRWMTALPLAFFALIYMIKEIAIDY